jgi:excisionase family DNA binding protein
MGRRREMGKRMVNDQLRGKERTLAAPEEVQRIKIKDIASNCMVSQTTVRRWIEMGQLRAIRLPSGHYRISQVDYRRFLKESGILNAKSAFKSKS